MADSNGSARVLQHDVVGHHNHERLLLLNPFFSSTAAWKGLVPSLAARYEIVQLEYPGFGTQPVAPIESVEELSDRVRSLLESLPSKPLHIAGFSFGSWIAQQIASAGVRDLRSVILIGASDRIYRHGIHIVDQWLTMLDVMGIEAVIRQLGFWSFSTQTFESHPDFLAKYVAGTLRACADPQVLSNHLQVVRAYQVAADLSRLDVPLLLLRGNLDFFCPRFCSLKIKGAVTNARLEEIIDAGHAVLWEQASAVADKMWSFLQHDAHVTR